MLQKVQSFKGVVWITQLVVAEAYRSRKIAQNLVHMALGSDYECAGIASSHPHAVLALEHSMHSECNVHMIVTYHHELLDNAAIPYLQDKEVTINDQLCVVNTEFAIDHTEPRAALAALKVEWKLGQLPAGHEFLAIVFRNNLTFAL